MNWGEVDQKGFNLVEFNLGARRRRDVSIRPLARNPSASTAFPSRIPRAMKFVVELGPSDWRWKVSEGFQIWLVDAARKGCRHSLKGLLGLVSQRWRASRLPRDGRSIPTETVRAAEITQAMSLRHKYEIWTEASEGEVAKLSVAEKADQLEREGQQLGFGDLAIICG